jgi:hypothetical protein
MCTILNNNAKKKKKSGRIPPIPPSFCGGKGEREKMCVPYKVFLSVFFTLYSFSTSEKNEIANLIAGIFTFGLSNLSKNLDIKANKPRYKT